MCYTRHVPLTLWHINALVFFLSIAVYMRKARDNAECHVQLVCLNLLTAMLGAIKVTDREARTCGKHGLRAKGITLNNVNKLRGVTTTKACTQILAVIL